MTRLALAGATAVAAAAGLAGAADGSSERAAALRLASTKPLTVTGARFLARESVSVRATVDGTRYLRRVRATRTGTLTATFAGLTIVDRCNSDVFVRAIGARGSQATLKVGPLPQCPPRLGRP
jgi:hypothetical protein